MPLTISLYLDQIENVLHQK